MWYQQLRFAIKARFRSAAHFVPHNHNSDTTLGHRQVVELAVVQGHQPGRAILAGAHEANKLQHWPPGAEPNTRPILVADCPVVADQGVMVDTDEQAE